MKLSNRSVGLGREIPGTLSHQAETWPRRPNQRLWPQIRMEIGRVERNVIDKLLVVSQIMVGRMKRVHKSGFYGDCPGSAEDWGPRC